MYLVPCFFTLEILLTSLAYYICSSALAEDQAQIVGNGLTKWKKG
jgi:hypothetical protein